MLNVTMMLADYVSAADGKLFINGGGWSIIGPGPAPGAIAMAVKIPWDERELEHKFVFELLDADGQPVLGQTPFGVQPMRLEIVTTMPGPFDGVKPGTPLDQVIPLNYPPIPLAPGARYEWRLSVNGETREEWRLAFSTRPLEAQGEGQAEEAA